MPCSKCGAPRDRQGQRYCRSCHNAYMRENRPKHAELPEWQRKRANARSYLNVYVRRGKVQRPATCSKCGEGGKIEGHHHAGYDRPLDVVWLCRSCHQAAHA